MQAAERPQLCWVVFFSRVMAGLLFGMAGYYKVFVMTAQTHAQRLFVEGYAETWIPVFLLWTLGLAIPYVELIGGWLLVVGWRRRTAAVMFGLLLLTVTYGHALKEPFFNISTSVLPRFLLLILVLLWDETVDRWSVDGWLARRKRG